MSSWRERVQTELGELTELTAKLRRFMLTEEYFQLPSEQRALLRKQAMVMNEYADILIKRLEIAG